MLAFNTALFAQSAVIGNPLAIGQNCGGGGSNFKSFTYDSVAKKLTQVGANCTPNLQSPGFNPGGGSIAFSPRDQKVYYIETTTGNNSIVWSWTPGVCPTGAQAPIYTYSSTFIVGLEFNAITGDGYQLEFSTGSAPYTIYLRKVTSFGPPLVAGAAQQIFLPAGKNIYQQNGDITITPTGKMYFILNNKMFYLDYSTYGTGTLNATYIDTLQNGTGNNIIGLSYVNGNFIASVQGSSCSYKQINISSGSAVVSPVTLASGTFVSYDMASMLTGIGAAKKLNSVVVTGTNMYQLTYYIKVKNYGNVNLGNVQLMDSVAKVFGAAFVSASAAAVGTLPSGLTINPSFDGNIDARIFSPGGTMVASPADSAIVSVSVNISNPGSATYLNSAIATATGTIFANNVRDSSNNQILLNPDPSGTDIPDVPGEGVPTPFNVITWTTLNSQIINFNAQPGIHSNTLNWKLENQVPGNIIRIERSADGINFETVSTIGALGSSDQKTYSWNDYNPLSGNNFYRLVLNNPSGSSLISKTVSVIKQRAIYDLAEGPNPFISSFKFSINLDKADKVSYSILDMVSNTLVSGQYEGQPGMNNFTIDNLNNLSAGNYILQVIVSEKRYFKKIVKKY